MKFNHHCCINNHVRQCSYKHYMPWFMSMFSDMLHCDYIGKKSFTKLSTTKFLTHIYNHAYNLLFINKLYLVKSSYPIKDSFLICKVYIITYRNCNIGHTRKGEIGRSINFWSENISSQMFKFLKKNKQWKSYLPIYKT